MISIYEFNQKYGDIFCTNHNGKMEYLTSISTSPLMNPCCLARSKKMDQSAKML